MTIIDAPVNDVNVYHPTPEEAEFAASIFGSISDARDAAGPDDFEVEPVDQDELTELSRHFEVVEQYDPGEPDPDFDEQAREAEEACLAEIGILHLMSDGMWGHLA